MAVAAKIKRNDQRFGESAGEIDRGCVSGVMVAELDLWSVPMSKQEVRLNPFRHVFVRAPRKYNQVNVANIDALLRQAIMNGVGWKAARSVLDSSKAFLLSRRHDFAIDGEGGRRIPIAEANASTDA